MEFKRKIKDYMHTHRMVVFPWDRGRSVKKVHSDVGPGSSGNGKQA